MLECINIILFTHCYSVAYPVVHVKMHVLYANDEYTTQYVYKSRLRTTLINSSESVCDDGGDDGS